MIASKKTITYTLLGLIVLIIIILLVVQMADKTTSLNYKAPIYNISISEEVQQRIWTQCQENKLSYELILSIYEVENINTFNPESITSEIEELRDIRNYWSKQGIPDEVVFDLLLLSRQRGIEGCKVLIKKDYIYGSDEYVKNVAEYKYNLEQSL